MAKSIKVGDRVPDFSLPDQEGKTVSSGDLLGKGPVVIYFYPKDFTPGCTAEACAFRDAYEVFQDAGAEVVGVSADSADKHASFAETHRLPFVLLADQGNRVRDAFGVKKTLGLLPGRVTFVVDKEGVVQHVFSSAVRMKAHVDEALAVVKRLSAAAA